jgi:hypothetical protein
MGTLNPPHPDFVQKCYKHAKSRPRAEVSHHEYLRPPFDVGRTISAHSSCLHIVLYASITYSTHCKYLHIVQHAMVLGAEGNVRLPVCARALCASTCGPNRHTHGYDNSPNRGIMCPILLACACEGEDSSPIIALV